MSTGQASWADPSGRRWSLRGEWSRAFAIMLALLLVAAVSTILGVRALVDEVQGTARQLHRESVTVALLQTTLVNHEQTAHKLLSDEPVDRTAFVRQQQDIVAEFARARTIFPTTDSMRAIVVSAEQSWQTGLETYHLWGAQALAMEGNHAVDNPTFGAASDATDALLDGIEGPSLEAMNKGLTHGAELERILIVGLAALFGVAMATTWYFRRRMARDLVRPVAALLHGVLQLHAGDYDHRIEVARRDELGELAEAFNGMAAALHEGHVALSLRASHDSLTGLANRSTLNDRLTAAFAPGTEYRARHESLLFIDIDDFKNINDSVGHAGGDALLLQLAERLRECVRPYDLVARLGGDEFAIVVVEDAGGFAASEVAERILAALRLPFVVDGKRLAVSVSIGVARRRPETQDASELLRDADFAMYMAKGGGKNRYQLYDPRMHEDMLGHSALISDLSSVVASGQLRLDYQPIADLHTGLILGVEALVRWQHPTRGLIGPGEFIELAEKTGAIGGIGAWVLETAARDAAQWRREIPGAAELWVSVNLSGVQLNDPDSLSAVKTLVCGPDVDAERLILEITETALAVDFEGAIAALSSLRALGVRVAIDDFGTGFSSLSTLARLPVDILKIDRSFVSGQSTSTPSRPMLEGILGLARKLELPVIAEGIEEDEQLALLRVLDCPLGQGYLLARPTAAPHLATLLRAGALVRPTVGAT